MDVMRDAGADGRSSSGAASSGAELTAGSAGRSSRRACLRLATDGQRRGRSGGSRKGP
ncbi:hypothetical protein JYU34_011641 [Plutella xylostella]|uniref:Uncharacterized protein n=1 Tax=Plutella xylostella TaxID=51655 RepID=A0ABQ7QEI9_PLUXY|nr:hypothetical protein JYU34_011641 [Plutella xylostella]